MPKRPRSSNLDKRIKEVPQVSAKLKSYVTRALQDESGSTLVPQLVTKFPKHTGPKFINVTVAFENTAVKPKSK